MKKMINVQKDSKKGVQLVKQFKDRGEYPFSPEDKFFQTSIEDVYKNPSQLKIDAFKEAEERCKSLNGVCFHVTDFSPATFTVGYETVYAYYIETAKYIYKIDK